ncbi:MAG TPA: glycosyltransferase [Chitinophagales bacterium]|nr:glycosyltransferase [Chitinophagales bacterium]
MQDNIAILINKINKKKGNLISIIMPLFNEEQSLPFVLKELFDYLPVSLPQYNFEITFIDDCSTDRSYSIVKDTSKSTPANIKLSVVQLSKNSGSHVAITAGINISRGDFTIIMSSDGQDPAEVVALLIKEWENDNELVLASRADNLDQGIVSKTLSRYAWKLMNWSTNIDMPETGCDVLGMDKIVVDAFNKMDERNTTFIFRILSLGFKKKEIQYIKRARVGGISKWTFLKKIAIIFDAITGFSNRPLRLITGLGLFVFVILVFRWIFVVFNVYILDKKPTELTIILNTLFTALAVQVLILGVIGDYIWRILDETRKRPVYEIRKVDGDIFEN